MPERLEEYFVRWFTGGLTYFYLEILFRGYSHYSMFVLGGICFLLVGEIGDKIMQKKLTNAIKIILIMLAGTMIITVAELFTGIVVNELLHMEVWDYSDMKYNYRGQICLTFSAIWAMVSLVCVYMNSLMKMMLFNQKQ